MRVLVLEPYYGGSHRTVLDGLLERLDVEVDLLALPARKWKWRMRGAAITMASDAARMHDEWESVELDVPDPSGRPKRWDLIYASTFVNLAEFYGMAGAAVEGVPSIVYFHENQLVYPNRHEAEWDYQFPLTNITSALAATRCVFNTEWTRETFISGIPDFLRLFPDHHPPGVAERIAAKSEVIAPPFDPEPFDRAIAGESSRTPSRTDVPRIIWPHRWEHDKDPDTFLEAVGTLAREGLDFEVAIAGQSFRDIPDSISAASDVLGKRLVHVGEPESREEYAGLLASADIAVSTARSEFFGLAMLEAAYSGCFPLVPERLAYPEIYPAKMRYASDEELTSRLRSLILEPPSPGQGRALAEEFTFDRLTPQYAALFETVAESG